MANRTPETTWMYFEQAACLEEAGLAEELIDQLRESFTQVHVAADFLLLEMDPAEPSPQLQLACLIKEKLAAIQEQVQMLYQALSRELSPCITLEQ